LTSFSLSATAVDPASIACFVAATTLEFHEPA
jgi:hypothetical protein